MKALRGLLSLVLSAGTMSFVISDSVALAQTTQPTTQPTVNLDELLPLVRAAGGIYQSVHDAIDKDDLDTAATLTSDLLEMSDAIMAKLKGSPLELPASMGFKQIKRLHEALVAKDAEKAKTLMAGIDRIGQGISDAIEVMMRASTTQPNR